MKNESGTRSSCTCVPPALPGVLAALGLLAGVFLLPLTLWGHAQVPAQVPEDASPTPPAAQDAAAVRLLRGDGTVEILTLEDYVWGVVAAEMPAAFHPEALKAQAVAARTYTLKKCAGQSRHPGADLCDDSACCQAYRTIQEALDAWGPEDGPRYAQTLRDAVAATAGEVLCYDGEPIQAVFHSSSDGYTADAVEVWGRAEPYLVSVSTPETADTVPNFETSVTFSPENFREIVKTAYPEAVLEGEPSGWFTDLERADWGGVTSLTVGGVALTGGEVRKLCALRSARFTVDADDRAVTFTVTAYGHGVGMSQYGANLMARQGAGYQEILAHYYPGTELKSSSRP